MPQSSTSYGLEVAGDRAIVVRRRGGRDEVVLDTGSGVGDQEALRRQLGRDISGGRATLAAAVGAHESVMRRLIAPLAAPDKARRVLPSLLDVELPFPLEKCVYGFPSVLPTAAGQTEALAVAVRREEWEAVLLRCTQAVGEPTHLDHEALAIWEQGRLECPDLGPGLSAVFYIGHDHATCALGRGEALLAAPSVRRSGEPLAALAARLAPTLRALLEKDADQVFPWLLAGPGVATREAAEEAQRALPRPGGPAASVARAPAAFLARALARRAAGPCALPCQLRRDADEHPALRTRRERAVLRAQSIALAAGLALLVGSLGWRAWLGQRTETLRADLNREAVTLTGLSRVPRGQEVELARRALADRGRRSDPFLAAVSGSTLDLVTRLTAASREAGATLERLRVEGPVFELAGRALDPAAGDRLVAGLATLGWNSELVHGEAGPDEPKPFTIKGAR